MNPRQRRGALLMILAALGAVVVFVSVLSYVGQVAEQVGNPRTVLRLTQNVGINKEITSAVVEEVQRPARWMPNTAIDSIADVQGKVAAGALRKGSYLQLGMVKNVPALGAGEREIAIMINAETSVAGKVTPGSVVDIYATFPATEQHPACALRVLSAVEIIQIGQKREQQETSGGRATTESVVPITFALPGNESLSLTYVEANAETVRLARIGGGESAPKPKDNVICQLPGLEDQGGQR